jgi:hypothetical protein
MTKPLTAIAIANLKSRVHRYEISDAGCQGLRVVVFPSRRKSFVLRYRFRGLQRKLTLGPCMIEHNGEGEPAEAPEQDTCRATIWMRTGGGNQSLKRRPVARS